jgi:hypothetical protein
MNWAGLMKQRKIFEGSTTGPPYQFKQGRPVNYYRYSRMQKDFLEYMQFSLRIKEAFANGTAILLFLKDDYDSF